MDSADSLQSPLKGVAHLHPRPALSGTSIPASPSHWLFSGLPDVSALRRPAHSQLRHLWLLLLRFWELLPQRITGFCCRCCFLSLFRSQLKCYSSKRLGLTTRLPGNPAPPATFTLLSLSLSSSAPDSVLHIYLLLCLSLSQESRISGHELPSSSLL